MYWCDSGSGLQAAGRKLSRKPTANVPRNKAPLHLQIFDFGGKAWITNSISWAAKCWLSSFLSPFPGGPITSRPKVEVQFPALNISIGFLSPGWLFLLKNKKVLSPVNPPLCATQSIVLLGFQLCGSGQAGNEGFSPLQLACAGTREEQLWPTQCWQTALGCFTP